MFLALLRDVPLSSCGLVEKRSRGVVAQVLGGGCYSSADHQLHQKVTRNCHQCHHHRHRNPIP